MTGLFGEDDAPAVATPELKREALERELRYRRGVYKRRVSDGKMTQKKADYEIWILERILEEGYQP